LEKYLSTSTFAGVEVGVIVDLPEQPATPVIRVAIRIKTIAQPVFTLWASSFLNFTGNG
jgi:hypothetical protein